MTEFRKKAKGYNYLLLTATYSLSFSKKYDKSNTSSITGKPMMCLTLIDNAFAPYASCNFSDNSICCLFLSQLQSIIKRIARGNEY